MTGWSVGDVGRGRTRLALSRRRWRPRAVRANDKISINNVGRVKVDNLELSTNLSARARG